MFELNCKDVKLKSLTTRTEKHGHEKVPAASLKCAVTMPNTMLEKFDSRLLNSFYENKKAEQGELLENDMFPDLLFEKLGVIPWGEEYDCVRVKVINDLNTEEARFIFPECKVKGFKFTFKDGGSVDIEFTINCRPEDSEIGWLYGRQEKNIMLTIEPPEEAQLDSFDGFEESEGSEQEESTGGRSKHFDSAVEFMRSTDVPTIEGITAFFQITQSAAKKLLAELESACWITPGINGKYTFNEL
jgi:hypothetical protein